MPASWRTPLRVTGGGAPTSSHGSCSEEAVHAGLPAESTSVDLWESSGSTGTEKFLSDL